MSLTKKIATCCYCGTRSVLVLDKARHELSCGACGAPLHDMKFMPKDTSKKRAKSGERPASGARNRRTANDRDRPERKPKKSSKKKGKSLFFRALDEIWDEVEDIFD